MARQVHLPEALSKQLALSAGLKNILVHEYDFDTDYRRFYDSAKQFIPSYKEYATAIMKHTG